jgi:hypothetical protein
MYKPSTNLVITYFPTYRPMFESISYIIVYQGETEY